MTTALIFHEDGGRRSCEARLVAVDGNRVRLDRTVFYPTGGGQPGDTGLLRGDGAALRVVDTVKGEAPDDVIHLLDDGTGCPWPPGATVEAAIDWPRRHRHMRMHTALHLLCAAIEGDVTGGQIGAEKSRLDFNLPAGALDKEALTHSLNALVDAAHPVSQLWIDADQLAARPELVRTLSVKPPATAGRIRLVCIGDPQAPVDLQPCGGTHVATTAEIGRIEVTRIENKGRQNRRVSLVLADA